MIDPQIALQSQAPNTLQLLSGISGLKGQQIQQQGQVQQQEQRAIDMQGQQLDNQGKSLALAGATQQTQDAAHLRAATAAATDPQTGNVDKGVLISTLGQLNPFMAAQTASTFKQQDQAAAEAATKFSDLQLKSAMAHVEAKDKLLQGVNDQPTYTNAVNQGIQLGIVKPGELPAQYDPQLVQQLHAQTLNQQAVITNHLNQQKEQDTVANQQATLANTAAHQRVEEKQGAQRIGLEGARLNLERQKYKDAQGVKNGVLPDGTTLVDAIGSGHIAPDRLGYLLSKNPQLLEGVMQKYPDFDSSKVGSYSQVYKDFTSGQTSKALNAGATALGHLAELKELNTYTSRIPGTEAHQKYENKVDTLATELAKFYGDSTVSGIANIKKTLDSTFNRDAAIQTQAQSMGDKLDAFQQTWDNAAPSKSYQAPMPGISPKAIAARQAIAGGGKAAESSATTVTAPNGKTYNFPDAAAAAKFKAAAGIQ